MFDPTEMQEEAVLNRLVALNLSLMVLIRVLQIPEEPAPLDKIEAVLMRLSDALDVVLNDLSGSAGEVEDFNGTASPGTGGLTVSTP